MIRIRLMTLAMSAAVTTAFFAPQTGAQNLSDRIRQVREQTQREDVTPPDTQEQPSIRERMGYLIASVSLTDVTARDAVLWWSKITGVPLVVDWRSLENAGVNPDKPINIQAERVPVSLTLKMILKQLSPEFTDLLYQQSPYFVEVMTKDEANRRTVVRVYDITDLTFEVRNFDNAPEFDLDSVLEGGREFGGGQGGGGGGSSQSLFGGSGTRNDQDDEPRTRSERGQEIAQLIRETIEPDIWQLHGGQHSSIRFFDGRLVINAPLYVHEQIALPRVGGTARGSGAATPPSNAEPARRVRSDQHPAGVGGSASPVAKRRQR